MYNSRVKNIELPENLFSNLGEMKSRKITTPQTPTFIKKELTNLKIPSLTTSGK